MNNTSKSSSSEEPSGQHQADEILTQLVPIAVLIVITNGLVFLLFGKLRSLRTPANYLLLSLAMSDVMTGLINIPLFCVLSTLDDQTLDKMNSVYCASEVFHNVISCSVAYHITAITVEKYLAVVNPFGRFLMTKKTVVKILSTVWLWSAFLGAIPASWWSSWWNGERRALYVQTGNNIFSLVVVFVIPYIFILYAYFIMFKAVSCKNRFKKSLDRKDPPAFKRASNEKKCLIILLTMAIAFAICWIPWFTLRLIFSLAYIGWIDGEELAYMEHASHAFIIIRYLSSAINPLLYTFFKQDFWNAFKVVVLKKKPRRPSVTLSMRQTVRLRGSDQLVDLLAPENNVKTDPTSV